jgi:hypothetical protein
MKKGRILVKNKDQNISKILEMPQLNFLKGVKI